MANYQTLKEHDMRNLLMVLKKPKKCGGFLFLLKLIAPNGLQIGDVAEIEAKNYL